MTQTRPLSLKDFAHNMPPGLINQDPSFGRYVFGGRACDTVPYVVAPGASPIVYEEDIMNMPITTQVFVFIFDMSNHAHKQGYQVVLNAIQCRWYKTLHHERHYDKDTKNVVIYLEVLEQHRRIEVTQVYDQMMAKLQGKTPTIIK